MMKQLTNSEKGMTLTEALLGCSIGALVLLLSVSALLSNPQFLSQLEDFVTGLVTVESDTMAKEEVRVAISAAPGDEIEAIERYRAEQQQD